MWAYILDFRCVKLSGALPIVALCSVASRRFHLVQNCPSKFVCGRSELSDDERKVQNYRAQSSTCWHLHRSFSKDQNGKSKVESNKATNLAVAIHNNTKSGIQHKLKNNTGVRHLPVIYTRHKNEICSLTLNPTSLPIVFQVNKQQSLTSFSQSNDLKNAAKKLTDLLLWRHVQDFVYSVVKVRKDCPDDIIIRHHHGLPMHWYGNDIISWENYPVTMLGNTDNYLNFDLTDDKKPVLSMDSPRTHTQEKPGTEENNNGKASKEQLAVLHQKLSDEMPRFYEKGHDFSIYSTDVEFNNQFLGFKTTGKSIYQGLVRTLKYSSLLYLVDPELELLKLTVHHEGSNIQARWRIKALPCHVWWMKIFKRDKSPYYRYYDAFSTFYVGTDGLIHLHKLDKVMPDSPMKEKVGWFNKLRWLLGITRPAYSLQQ